MGKGVVKRGKVKHRRAKWSKVLHELERCGGDVIPDLGKMIRAGTGGRQLTRNDQDQVNAYVRTLVRHVNGGYQVIPNKLNGELALLPPFKPAIARLSPPTPLASVPTGETKMEELEVEQVMNLLKISLAEADAFVAAFPDGTLPPALPKGLPTKLGIDLCMTLRSYGLLKSEGRGRGAISHPQPAMFSVTRFVVDAARHRRKQRWVDLPKEHWETRPAGSWLEEIKRQLADIRPDVSPEADAVPPVEPAATTSLPNTEQNVRLLLRLFTTQLDTHRRELEEAKEAARPYFNRLVAMEAALKEIEAAISDLKGLLPV